jgi:bla regulator protein blaR1
MTLLAMALKAGLVLLLTALVAHAARKSSAAWRHLIWTTGLAVSLLLPVAASVLPDWKVVPAAGIKLEPLTAITMGSSPATGTPAVIGFLPALTMIWTIGMLLVLAWVLAGRISLLRWVRRARAVTTPAWRETITDAMINDSGSRRVRFLEADWITTPCAWGMLRPTVLLPIAGASWPVALRRSALAHELAHLRRLDPFAHTVGRLACAIHWYNPLVWLAARSARLEREQACDDAVLAGASTSADYAGFLVEVARGASRERPLAGALGLAHRSSLGNRIRALLDPTRRRGPVRRPLLVGVICGGLALMLSLAALAPAPVPAQEPTPVRQDTVVRRPVKADSTVIRKVAERVCYKVRSDSTSRNGEARVTVRYRVTGTDSVKVVNVRVRNCSRD